MTGNGTERVNLDWTVAIPNGHRFAYSAGFNQEEFNSYQVKEKFTFGGVEFGNDVNVPVLGLRIEPNGNFWLSNAYESAVEFTKIAIEISSSGLSEEEILNTVYDLAEPEGFLGGVVSGGQEFFLGRFDLQPGEFLTAHMLTSFLGERNGPTSELILQHEHQIPAPGALALLGLAGLVGTRRRRR